MLGCWLRDRGDDCRLRADGRERGLGFAVLLLRACVLLPGFDVPCLDAPLRFVLADPDAPLLFDAPFRVEPPLFERVRLEGFDEADAPFDRWLPELFLLRVDALAEREVRAVV